MDFCSILQLRAGVNYAPVEQLHFGPQLPKFTNFRIFDVWQVVICEFSPQFNVKVLQLCCQHGAVLPLIKFYFGCVISHSKEVYLFLVPAVFNFLNVK